MFFILSKVLLFLLVPFWWIVFLGIWRIATNSATTKKRLGYIMVFLFLVLTNPFLFRQVNLTWQPVPVILEKKVPYEVGILLGGMSGYDMNEVGYFGNNADRFIQTCNLYHQGIIKKILVSGGIGLIYKNSPPETKYLHQQLLANGIPDSAILLDSQSRNTYENAVYSKIICDSLKIQSPVVLITSAFHMKRSEAVFKKAGFSFVPFPCDYKVIPKKFSIGEYFIPRIELLEDWSYLIKEMVGLVVYKITGKA